MTYRELQQALKGHTTVKLNSKQAVLQAEYDRLFLDGSFCELTCEVVITTFVKPQPRVETPTKGNAVIGTNKIQDLAGGSFYQRPVLKTKVNAQQVSEVKRQASQAPRLATPVKDKYSNKKAVNDIRQQQIKGSPNKVSCKFNSKHDDFFVNTNHKRYVETLGSTERRALENVKQFVGAVKEFAQGFAQAQARRNAA